MEAMGGSGYGSRKLQGDSTSTDAAARDYWLRNVIEQLRPWEEAGVTVLGKSRHLKVIM